MTEKETLSSVLESLNDALNWFEQLDDDEAHAGLYWEIKGVAENVVERIEEAFK